MYFYDSNTGPTAAGPSYAQGPQAEHTCQRATRPCYISNFKHLRPVVLNMILNIFNVFSVLKPRTPWGLLYLGSGGHKLGKGPLANAAYQISSNWAKPF